VERGELVGKRRIAVLHAWWRRGALVADDRRDGIRQERCSEGASATVGMPDHRDAARVGLTDRPGDSGDVLELALDGVRQRLTRVASPPPVDRVDRVALRQTR